MNKKITAAIAVSAALAISCAFMPDASADGWTGDPGNSGYVRDGGFISGVEAIDGIYYLFDGTDSAPSVFTGMTRSGSHIIYVFGGVSAENTPDFDGWITVDGNKYYLKNGRAVTGTKTIGDTAYYFDENGVLGGKKTITADAEDTSSSTETKSSKKKTATVTDPNKDAWESSTEIVKSLSSDDGEFTLEGNYLDMFYGTGASLNLDLYTNNGTELTIKSAEVQRRISGKWAKASATDNKAAKSISKTQIGGGDNHAVISFVPDLYFKKAADGLHRVVIKVETADGGTRTFQYEFNMAHNADVSCKKSYNLVTTKSITFTSTVNTECELYPEINELFFWDNNKWNTVFPKKKKGIASETETVGEGTYESVLKLTRYDTNALKSGKYMVYVGDDVTATFYLRRPVDVKGVQVRTADVQLTFTNRGSDAVNILDYNALWKASGSKWNAIPTRDGADTSAGVAVSKGKFKTRIVDISSMYGDLEQGSYRMRILTDSGDYIYAYFTIVE